jgi:hypothetical protein
MIGQRRSAFAGDSLAALSRNPPPMAGLARRPPSMPVRGTSGSAGAPSGDCRHGRRGAVLSARHGLSQCARCGVGRERRLTWRMRTPPRGRPTTTKAPAAFRRAGDQRSCRVAAGRRRCRTPCRGAREATHPARRPAEIYLIPTTAVDGARCGVHVARLRGTSVAARTGINLSARNLGPLAS